MTPASYIQIHMLQGYAGVLLNRDEAGQAKRMLYGGESRTRISSQCLKRHWRTRAGTDALESIPGVSASIRSRDTIKRRIIEPLAADGYSEDVRKPINATMDAETAATAAKKWGQALKMNLRAMRTQCSMPGGLWAACCGRMNTSDAQANIDGPVHVAHAFTTHGEEIEYDFFSVVDDLHEAGTSSGNVDHINESEIGCGLYYVYVMVDRNGLLANVDGDTELAGEIVRRLVRITATVSPGSRRGATAPYTRAAWMLIETGEEQPRTLAEAFRRPSAPTRAQAKINDYLKGVDGIYGNTNDRLAVSIDRIPTEGARTAATLDEMAAFARNAVTGGKQ